MVQYYCTVFVFVSHPFSLSQPVTTISPQFVFLQAIRLPLLVFESSQGKGRCISCLATAYRKIRGDDDLQLAACRVIISYQSVLRLAVGLLPSSRKTVRGRIDRVLVELADLLALHKRLILTRHSLPNPNFYAHQHIRKGNYHKKSNF